MSGGQDHQQWGVHPASENGAHDRGRDIVIDTDTRYAAFGDLGVQLDGPRADGNDTVPGPEQSRSGQARGNGAAAKPRTDRASTSEPRAPRQPRPRRGLARLLSRITGYHPEPDDPRLEGALYSALGFSVLVTTGLAAFSMTVVVGSFGSQYPWSVRALLPLGWSVVIFSVELLIVRQINFDRRGFGALGWLFGGLLMLLLALARMVLAIVLAFLVAEPLIALAFADKVEQQLRFDHIDSVAARSTTLLMQDLQSWRAKYAPDVENYQAKIKKDKADQSAAAQQVENELKGVGDCGYGDPGQGDCYRAAQRHLAAAQQAERDDVADCRKAIRGAVEALAQTVSDNTAKANKEKQTPPENGILARLTALQNIERLRNQPETPPAPPTSATATRARTAGTSPSLRLSCDPDAGVPSTADLLAYAQRSSSTQSAEPSGRVAGVTHAEAQYVFDAHWALRVVLLILDLFPLLTKQSLRHSRYSHRVKTNVRRGQDVERALAYETQAETKLRIGEAKATLKAAKPTQRHSAKLSRSRARADLLAIEQQHDYEQRHAAMRHDGDLEILRREIEHEHAKLDVKHQEELRRLQKSRGQFPDEDENSGSTLPYPNLNDTIAQIAQLLRPGSEVDGRWRLKRQMTAREGYSYVWRADDLRPEPLEQTNLPSNEAVIKLIEAKGYEDGFAEELKVAERISRDAPPHIAPVLGTGEVKGEDGQALLHYLAQPYYPLGNLSVYKRQHHLNLMNCLAVSDQVLRGLDWAHYEAGRLHLDIKPENIVMAPGRRRGTHDAYIIDWGLATAITAAERGTTRRGAGTFLYSAPEQFLRKTEDGADPRRPESDVYAVGATLYFLLTGEHPLEAEFTATFGDWGVQNWIAFLGNRPVPRPVDEIDPRIPPPVSDLVQRWLSFLPEDRVDRHDPDVPHQGAAHSARQQLRIVTRQVESQLDLVVRQKGDTSNRRGPETGN